MCACVGAVSVKLPAGALKYYEFVYYRATNCQQITEGDERAFAFAGENLSALIKRFLLDIYDVSLL